MALPSFGRFLTTPPPTSCKSGFSTLLTKFLTPFANKTITSFMDNLLGIILVCSLFRSYAHLFFQKCSFSAFNIFFLRLMHMHFSSLLLTPFRRRTNSIKLTTSLELRSFRSPGFLPIT